MTDYRKSALPYLHETERGRLLTPEYVTDFMKPVEFDVTPTDWLHVCSARFGEGRPCGFGRSDATKWTGDSHRYDIFKCKDGSRELVAVRWSHGGGDGWLVAEDKARRGEACLLLMIAAMPDEARRWDALHCLCDSIERTAAQVKHNEYKRVATAFVEGRLKKRKVRGKQSYDVQIAPAKNNSPADLTYV